MKKIWLLSSRMSCILRETDTGINYFNVLDVQWTCERWSVGLQVAGVTPWENLWRRCLDLKGWIEVSLWQDRAWKTVWQMLCYMRLKRDGVCREQLESHRGWSNGLRLYNGFGIESFLGASNMVRFLLLPIHQVRRRCFQRGQALPFLPILSHSLYKRATGKGVPECSAVQEEELKGTPGKLSGEQSMKPVLLIWSFSKTFCVQSFSGKYQHRMMPHALR